MKHSTEDILQSMIVATLNHVTYPEFVERLAMFFRNYMPVTSVGAYVFFDYRIVKIAEYAFTSTAAGPDTVDIDPEVLDRCIHESAYGDDFDIHLQHEDDAFAEFYAKVHTQPASSIRIPLLYYKDRMLYLSVSAYGRDRYTEDHVELCRLIRPALILAVSNMDERQRVDLRNTEALKKLKRYTEDDEDRSEGAASGGEGFLTLDEYTIRYIQKVLRHTRGRVAGKNGAAVILGMHVSTLWSKIRKFHIPVPRE